MLAPSVKKISQQKRFEQSLSVFRMLLVLMIIARENQRFEDYSYKQNFY